jgi:hypothetical protein
VTVTDNATVGAPGSYTKDVPANAYPSKVGVDQTESNNTVTDTFTFPDGANTVVIVVPPSAIHDGAHISVFRANSSFWSSSFSSSSRGFLDGYAVAWTNSGESAPSNAQGAVTMIVSNTSIVSSDTLFRATTSGIGTKTGTVGAGAWTVTFAEDPGFVLAQAAAAPPATTTTSASPSATTTVAAPTSGGGGTRTGGTTTIPISAGVLLIIVGTVVLGSGRRRENG